MNAKPLGGRSETWAICTVALKKVLRPGGVRLGGHTMWKRDEAVKPPQPATSSRSGPASSAGRTESAPRHERVTVCIGKSVVIKGELSGSEDLTIEGQVEGKIELRQNVLT